MSDRENNTSGGKCKSDLDLANQVEMEWLARKPDGLCQDGVECQAPKPERTSLPPVSSPRVTTKEIIAHDGSRARLKLVELEPRTPDGNLKTEMNFACEFPVCVGNRKDVLKPYIEVQSENGRYRMERGAASMLPAPEHYLYFLWAIEGFIRSTKYIADVPAIEINPPEIFDMFGGPRRGGGSSYDKLEEAFTRFSRCTVSQEGALYDASTRTWVHGGPSFHLFDFFSWRSTPKKDQQVLDFAKGYLVCGSVLWSLISHGKNRKSVPLEPLRDLSYIGQRLYMYLHRHCAPGGEFRVSMAKLLPKIPLDCTPNELIRILRPHHEALGRLGFLQDVAIDGRGTNKMITYRRHKQ